MKRQAVIWKKILAEHVTDIYKINVQNAQKLRKNKIQENNNKNNLGLWLSLLSLRERCR